MIHSEYLTIQNIKQRYHKQTPYFAMASSSPPVFNEDVLKNNQNKQHKNVKHQTLFGKIVERKKKCNNVQQIQHQYYGKNGDCGKSEKSLLKVSVKCGHCWEESWGQTPIKKRKNKEEANKRIHNEKGNNCEEYGLLFDNKILQNSNKSRNSKNLSKNIKKSKEKVRALSSNGPKFYQYWCQVKQLLAGKSRNDFSHLLKNGHVETISYPITDTALFPKKQKSGRSVSVTTSTCDLQAWMTHNSDSVKPTQTKIQTQGVIASRAISNQHESDNAFQRQRSVSFSSQQFIAKKSETCLKEEGLVEEVEYLRNLAIKLYQQKEQLQIKLKKMGICQQKIKQQKNYGKG